MTQGHPILTEFVEACQRHYACFILSVDGLSSQKNVYANSPPGAKIHISDKDPTKHPPTATLLISDLKQYIEKDGAFADALAKSLIVTIYSEWDEFYRPRFAKSIDVKKNSVMCPLIGDIRIIRNCIIHDNSVLKEKDTKLGTLDWNLSPGDLVISQRMFEIFIKQS